MCRKHFILSAASAGFGVGVWTGLFLESSLSRLLVGAAAIGVAFWLLRGN